MVTYNPYERYKDSGVEWIGEIPEHWSLTQVNKHFDICLGKMLQPEKQTETDTLEKYLCSINIDSSGINLDIVKEMWFSSVERSKYEILQGDLLVCEGGDVGKVAIWDGSINPCYIQNALHRLRPLTDNSNKFLMYWFTFLKTVGYIEMVCNKATMAHFTREKVARTVFIDLPFSEQQAIADFLDQKTSELDGLIADKEKLVTLLQEYRQAIISEAVTKGLNPHVKMKDSGVEWIGKIPEHWDVYRVKYLLREIDERSMIGNEDLLSVSQYYGIRLRETVTEKVARADSLVGYKLCKQGDVVINKMLAWQGALGHSKYDGIVSPDYTVIRTFEAVSSRYIAYLFKTPIYTTEFTKESKGIIPSRWRLHMESLGRIYSLVPPFSEQQAIADYLDQKTSEVDDLISGIQESIAQLKSYRQSLISEAVTGKIDVRGVI